MFTFFKTGVTEKEPEKMCAKLEQQEKGQGNEQNWSGRKRVPWTFWNV